MHGHDCFVLPIWISELMSWWVDIWEQGAIRNCVLAIQREVLQGDLLRDVLRLGPSDVEGIVKMAKDVLQRVFAPAPQGQRGEL